MVKPWDETMKQLVDASPQQFLDWLAPGSRFLEFVPTELLKPKEEEEPLRADRCLAVELDGEVGIVHLEIQSGPDAHVAERLLGYNLRLTANDPLQRPVYSYVIYLRPVSNPPQSPLVRTFLKRQEVFRFNYGSVELAELEYEVLLELGLPGLLPLLPLTKGGKAHEVVLTMFDRLQHTARADLLGLGAMFASLVYGKHDRAEQAWLERVIQDMHDIIQETPLYQLWTGQAREEGLKEGELKGLRQVLVDLVQARFPRLISLARTRAAQIEAPEVLNALIIQVSTAANAQEARHALRADQTGEPRQPTSQP